MAVGIRLFIRGFLSAVASIALGFILGYSLYTYVPVVWNWLMNGAIL